LPRDAHRTRRRAFRATTARGVIRARDVVIATNGYTSALTPWLGARDPDRQLHHRHGAARSLADGEADAANRIASDTRKVVFYYARHRTGNASCSAGRVSTNETDPAVSGPLLHAEMVRIFPELATTRISHRGPASSRTRSTSWRTSAIAKDCTMRWGIADPASDGRLSRMKLGLQVLGREEGRTAFDGLPFQTRPLYFGRPWFLGAALRYYRWRDRSGR
jgi:hypothetical protein